MATAAGENMKQYSGNCHCGAFRFTITIPPLTQVQECNCSLCTRNGYLWIFPIPDDDFSIEKGDGTLKVYKFGGKTLAFMFCPICGTSVMGRLNNSHDGKSIGINARALQDVDVDTLRVEIFNGAGIDPPYEPPPAPRTDRKAQDGLKIYNGNCHCGAVTYIVETKPLTELKVMSCNCSLCSRNGDLWIYPKKANVEIHGRENLTGYAFLDENSLHSFCSICGVSMVVIVLGDGPDDDVCPVNVRTISGIEVDQLKVQKYSGRENDPQYVLRN